MIMQKFIHKGVFVFIFFPIVPTALYRAEAWGMRSAERRKVNVLQMKCLRSWLECRKWIELGMKRCVGELE